MKKRGAISSAWLEKYKPDLTENPQEIDANSAFLAEKNDAELRNVSTDESSLSEKGLHDGMSSQQSGSCDWSVEGPASNHRLSSFASATGEKSYEVKSLSNNPECKENASFGEECLKSEQKQQEDRMNKLNGDVCPEVTASCKDISDRFTNMPDVANSSRTDSEFDNPQHEILHRKRKAREGTMDQKQPNKKVRVESKVDEEQGCDESNE